MKRIVVFFLSLSMLFGLVACGEAGGSSPSVNDEYKQEIAAAAKKLNDTYTNYIISTEVENIGGAQQCIEVVKGDDIYTEYSVSEEGEVGTIPYGSSDQISYTLVDWEHENTFYSFGYTEEGEVLYKFPESYATKYNNDREMLFVNRFLDGATEIKPMDDLELTLAGVTEKFKAYRIWVSSEKVTEILSADSWGVYMSVKESEKSGSNIDKLCDFYIRNSEIARTYSDGVVTVAIDQDGILKFMSLEVGGLGTTMYITKAVVDVRNPNVRELPDFSKAVPLVATMTEMADFIAQYPDYDSAVKALNERMSEEQAALEGLPNATEGTLTPPDTGKTEPETDGATTADGEVAPVKPTIPDSEPASSDKG